MSDTDNEKPKLGMRAPLGLRRTVETGKVKQSFSHGRSNTVIVETKKRRFTRPGETAPDAAPEAEAALQDLKKYLSSPPTLVAPKPQEPLLLYLAVRNQVLSAALVVPREVDDEEAAVASPSSDKPESSPAESGANKIGCTQANEVIPKKKMVQCLVYFVSSLLHGARSRYSGV